MDITIMQRDLINIITQTTDSKELAAIYDLVTKRKKKKEVLEKVETVIEKPRKEIPVAEIRKGVTLEEIRASQQTSKMTYEEFSKLVAEEEWEQSLEELLDSID